MKSAHRLSATSWMRLSGVILVTGILSCSIGVLLHTKWALRTCIPVKRFLRLLLWQQVFNTIQERPPIKGGLSSGEGLVDAVHDDIQKWFLARRTPDTSSKALFLSERRSPRKAASSVPASNLTSVGRSQATSLESCAPTASFCGNTACFWPRVMNTSHLGLSIEASPGLASCRRHPPLTRDARCSATFAAPLDRRKG